MKDSSPYTLTKSTRTEIVFKSHDIYLTSDCRLNVVD